MILTDHPARRESDMPELEEITGHQCRAARALIGWTRSDLAERSRVAASTIGDFETAKREPHPRTVLDLRRALEAAGIGFQPADAQGGPGVRLTAGK